MACSMLLAGDARLGWCSVAASRSAGLPRCRLYRSA